MSQEGISTDGGEDGVTVLKQGFNVDPLLQRQADCISTMTYNEFGQVLDAGVSEDELVTFKYEEQGVATLEDGIYALEENLEDPVFKDKMVRFVRASMKGWKYAEANPEEAAGIVLDNDETGAQSEAHQIRMMGEIAKLAFFDAPSGGGGRRIGGRRSQIAGPRQRSWAELLPSLLSLMFCSGSAVTTKSTIGWLGWRHASGGITWVTTRCPPGGKAATFCTKLCVPKEICTWVPGTVMLPWLRM